MCPILQLSAGQGISLIQWVTQAYLTVSGLRGYLVFSKVALN